MSGKEESLVERILKPVRINPLMLAAGIAEIIVGVLLWDNDNFVVKNLDALLLGSGAVVLAMYFHEIDRYRKEKRLLKQYGFSENHARNRMEWYCSRQTFYVACIEQGYRDEAKQIIEQTPKKQKKLAFLPHV